MRVSQRDGLGSASHASRRRASGSNGTIDIPAVVQRMGVRLNVHVRGKEWHSPRHLLRSSSFPHLRVACVRAALSPPSTISGPAGTQGRCAPARGSTRRPTIQHGAEQLWRTQEGAHGDEQTGACSAAERCITPGQDVLRSTSVLPRTAGHSPRQCRRTVQPGRKLTLSTSLLSARLSHRRRSWTTSVDIAFPRDPCDFPRP